MNSMYNKTMLCSVEYCTRNMIHDLYIFREVEVEIAQDRPRHSLSFFRRRASSCAMRAPILALGSHPSFRAISNGSLIR